MRAITLRDYESGPALQDLPTPEPTSTELRLRLHASSVNGVDAAIAAGMLKEMMEYDPPVTLGRDFAGVVDRVGADVTRYQVGDELYGFRHNPAALDGTWAEYVVAPENLFVASKPASLDFTHAGALPLAGVTALLAVDAIEPSEGDVVLVVGAGGGVGGYAVQLAARRGAVVIATAKPEDEARLRGLGAAETIDYTTRELVTSVRERHADGVQGLIDLVSFADGFAATAELVAAGGRAASSLGAADVERLAARQVAATNVMAVADPALLTRLAEHADAGELEVTIERVYPLERASEALDDFRDGKRGKIAITVD